MKGTQNTYKFLEKKENELGKLIHSTYKKIIDKELKHTSKKDYTKTNFFLSTSAYQRYDDLSGDFYIYLKPELDHSKLYEKIVDKKISIFEEAIQKEIILLKEKLENAEKVVEEYNKEKISNHEFWEDMMKEHENISVEGHKKEPELKDVKTIKKEIKELINILENRKTTAKKLDNINDDLLSYVYFDFHPIYHDTFLIRDYILDKDKFKKNEMAGYPIIKDEEDINEDFDIRSFLKGKYASQKEDITDKLVIASPIIETADSLKAIIKQIKEIFDNNEIKESNKEFYEDELKSRKKDLKRLNELAKELNTNHGKYPEFTNSYFLKKSSIANLAELMKDIIAEKYNIEKERLEKNNFYIELNFLNY